MELNDHELMNTTGGGISRGVYILFAGIITFVAGVIDGYLRPFSCSKKK